MNGVGVVKSNLRAKHEIHRTQQTERGLKVIQFERFVHVEHGEGGEDRQGNDFLHDFELRQAHLGVADAIGRHLDQILDAGDAPADQRGDVLRAVAQAFEMGVPSECHEDIGRGE